VFSLAGCDLKADFPASEAGFIAQRCIKKLVYGPTCYVNLQKRSFLTYLVCETKTIGETVAQSFL